MPFRYPKELIVLINYKDNYKKIAEKLGSEKLIEDFLQKVKLADESQKSHIYDFKAEAGDCWTGLGSPRPSSDLPFNEHAITTVALPMPNHRVV